MRVLVTGAEGLLGSAAAAEARDRGWSVRGLGRAQLDVTDAAAVRSTMSAAVPDVVLHCAAYTAVDRAETEPARALEVNRDGTAHVAAACEATGALLVYPSTDYVFDGRKEGAYLPGDPPNPLSVYGRSKLAGEEEARRAPRHLVARTSWLYGAGGRNFVDTILDRAEQGRRLRVVEDQRGRPTWTQSLAAALMDLVATETTGVVHVSDAGEASWHGLAVEALRLAGLDTVHVEPVSTEAWDAPAPRPRASLLDLSETERILGRPLPSWKHSLARYVAERRGATKGRGAIA